MLRQLVKGRYQYDSLHRLLGGWNRRSCSSSPFRNIPSQSFAFAEGFGNEFVFNLRKGCTRRLLDASYARTAASSAAPTSTSDGKNSEDSTGSSVDEKELEKFAETAALWWNKTSGPYSLLHSMNPVRCAFIRDAICQHHSRVPEDPRPLRGLSVLDVGCGGGLLCEPLARMGGDVTGIDAASKSVAIAAAHAERDPSTASIRYLTTTAEKLVEEGAQFDVVLSLEVIEHVKQPLEFVQALSALCRPQGLCFISTINRTPRSYGLAIAAAENILGWVPRGTHDFQKFLTPEELTLALHRAQLQVEEIAGMMYTPWLPRSWKLADDLGVNYIVAARKGG